MFAAIYSNAIKAQTISRIEPQNWWVGMKWNSVTLLVYGTNIGDLQTEIKYKGVSIEKTERVENKNYLFITLNISPEAKAGKLKIDFKQGNKIKISKDFSLLQREEGSATRESFSSKDAMYLIMSDRFSNGNPANDNVTGMKEKANRAFEGGRHGGDIKGIINHLDYIKSQGYTQIWNTPLIENDMPNYSYHGYAATDFYKIDPRYGTNEEYKTLVSEAKKRGLGLVWDVVLNHCGSEYYFIKDKPSKDWTNFPEKFIRTNHMKTTLIDPYATEIDKKEYTDGWFDTHMPDLNQRNPLVAKFLIQNNIWWVEYAGISGFRVDTFSYSDKNFLSVWAKAILNEYPNFNIVSEEWTNLTQITSYFQKGKVNLDGYKCDLPSVMDFALGENVIKTLNENSTWSSSWRNVYQSLALDYQFPNPNNMLIFPDNHDMDRFYTQINENFEHWKLAMALFCTMRGIPQFYYGTEVLMSNTANKGNDGFKRTDFYGGWHGDTKDAKTGKGLTDIEKEAQQYLANLLNWRKEKNVIHTGKLKHYAAQFNDVYIYFRYNDKEKVMVILNKNKEKVSLDLNRYSEMIPNEISGKDIISNKNISVKETLEIGAKTAMVLELK